MTTSLPERPLRLAFICSDRGDAVAAHQRLADRYGEVPAHEADVLVALGGDGLMLEALHERKGPAGKPLCPIYGVNLGTVGFLMNPLLEDNLIDRIRAAEPAVVHPLRMRAETMDGRTVHAYAFNEVSLLRQTRQTAKLRIRVDGAERMAELACDGALVSTPVGSTAYNLSAHGPIIPLNAQVMALTPISAFRPRYWRGALLSHKAEVRFETLEPEKRPVSAVADNVEVRSVTTVTVAEARDMQAVMLFDAGSGFEERVLAEQFST